MLVETVRRLALRARCQPRADLDHRGGDDRDRALGRATPSQIREIANDYESRYTVALFDFKTLRDDW